MFPMPIGYFRLSSTAASNPCCCHRQQDRRKEFSMEDTTKDYSHIKGWGIDADRKNDPTYPMKHRNDGEHAGYSWERPTQQQISVEVLHSNERPDLTAV